MTARARFRTAAAATAAVIACAGALALDGRGPSWVAMTLAAAFLPYAFLLVQDHPSGLQTARWPFFLATAVGLFLVAAPSALSDDLYRYLWDGRVSGAGIDPYLYAPDDPALFSLRDALQSRVNNPEIPTIYPPVAQLLFWLADRVDHAPWTIKALALAAHLATMSLLLFAAPKRHAPRAATVYGLNPLALSESALGGHVDVFAGLALLCFAVALAKNHRVLSVAAAVFATGTKLVGLVVAPLLAVRSRRLAAVALVLCVAVAGPIFFAGRGSDAVPGVGHYARRWQGNAGLFTVIESGARVVVDHVAARTWSAEGHVRLRALAPVVALLEGTPLDPWATQVGEKKEAPDRTDFQRAYVASMLARGVSFGLVVALVLLLLRRRTPPIAATRLTVFAVLLLAPQLHPWYVLWLLPLEAAAGRNAGFVLSATVVAAYAPLGTWLAERTWVESPLTPVLIHLPVLALLAWEARRRGLWRLPEVLGRRSPQKRPSPCPEGVGKIQ